MVTHGWSAASALKKGTYDVKVEAVLIERRSVMATTVVCPVERTRGLKSCDETILASASRSEGCGLLKRKRRLRGCARPRGVSCADCSGKVRRGEIRLLCVSGLCHFHFYCATSTRLQDNDLHRLVKWQCLSSTCNASDPDRTNWSSKRECQRYIT